MAKTSLRFVQEYAHQMAGYSGTPLSSKLGIRTGLAVHLEGAPANDLDLVAPLPLEHTEQVGVGAAARAEAIRDVEDAARSPGGCRGQCR